MLDGIEKTEERLTKPEYYNWVYCAERDVLSGARRDLISVVGAKIYSPWILCFHCAKEISSSGVEDIISHEDTSVFADKNNSTYSWNTDKSLILLDAAEHINNRLTSGKIFEDGFFIKFRNKDFSP